MDIIATVTRKILLLINDTKRLNHKSVKLNEKNCIIFKQNGNKKRDAKVISNYLKKVLKLKN